MFKYKSKYVFSFIIISMYGLKILSKLKLHCVQNNKNNKM